MTSTSGAPARSPIPSRPPPLARVSASRRASVAAPAERAFELLSPLGEYEWIDGWSCELVFPPSGAMEVGCIFHEPRSIPFFFGRPGRTTWVVTRRDPARLDLEFLVFLGPLALARLAVQGERVDAGHTAFTFALEVTALSPDASAELDGRKAEGMVLFLAEALATYCGTGAILPLERFLRAHGLAPHGLGHGAWLRHAGATGGALAHLADGATRPHRLALAAVGVVSLLAGVAHFFWMLPMRAYPELAGLTDAQWRFLALLNLCVGLLLAATGATALALARRADLGLLRAASAVLLAMWGVRLALELSLPVPVPFLGLAAPSRLFVPLIVALVGILAAPEVLRRARRGS